MVTATATGATTTANTMSFHPFQAPHSSSPDMASTADISKSLQAAESFSLQRPYEASPQDHPFKATVASKENCEADSDTETENLQEDHDEDISAEVPPFEPTQCLFCSTASTTLDANLAHMHKKHGLMLPTSLADNTLHLSVELKTLLQYLHLVIHGYHECLACHTQRHSAAAVVQHMLGKGHCRVDLDIDGESEFLDFYEAEGVSEGEDSEGSSSGGSAIVASSSKHIGGKTNSRVDKNTMRLSSGKLLSHRSTPPTPRANRKPLAESKKHNRHDVDFFLEDLMPLNTTDANNIPTENEATPSDPSTQQETSLSRADRRLLAGGTGHKTALTIALSKMSANDRAALAHLTPAERRATVVKQFKQQEKRAHAERKYWNAMEGKNNSVLQKFFVNDVPGPKNG